MIMVHHTNDSIRMYPNCLHHRPTSTTTHLPDHHHHSHQHPHHQQHHHQQQQQQQLQQRMTQFSSSTGGASANIGRSSASVYYNGYHPPSSAVALTGVPAPVHGNEPHSPVQGLRHPQSGFVVADSPHHVTARQMPHQFYQAAAIEYPTQSAVVQSGIECVPLRHQTQQQQRRSPTGGTGSASASLPSWIYATSPTAGPVCSNESEAGSPDWSEMCQRYTGSGQSFNDGDESIDMISPQNHHHHHHLLHHHESVAIASAADSSPSEGGNGSFTYLHSIDTQQHSGNHHSGTPTSAVSMIADSATSTGNTDCGGSGQQHVTSAVRRQLQNDTMRALNGNAVNPVNAALTSSPDWLQSQLQQQQQQHATGAPYDWMKKQTYPAVTPSGKTRTKDKYRIVYTELQKVELEKEFLFNQYITIQRKAELAVMIGLSDRQVKIWFQNRRAKERKHKRKREEVTGSTTRSSSSAMLDRGVNQPAVKASGINDTSRLRSQLQLHQQQRYSDVIKMESIGSELMASPANQQSSVFSL